MPSVWMKRASEPYIACTLNPQSKPVALGSSGLFAVSSTWLSMDWLARSSYNRPKLTPLSGVAGLMVKPPWLCADRWMPLIQYPGGGASAAGAGVWALAGVTAYAARQVAASQAARRAVGSRMRGAPVCSSAWIGGPDMSRIAI